MSQKRKSRIFITGDTHCDTDIHKLSSKVWKGQNSLKRDDVLLIAGDFGLPWVTGESKTDKYMLEWYSEKPYTIVFVDGNHDNEDALRNEYEVVSYRGAKCHKLRGNVFHLMRGEVLHIDDHRILGIGGARSVDIEYRIPHISWWPDEEPSYGEVQHALENLIKEKPDIIISHDAPRSVVPKLYGEAGNVTWTQKALEEIKETAEKNSITISGWYFGHHHTDEDIDIGGTHFHALYNTVVELK